MKRKLVSSEDQNGKLKQTIMKTPTVATAEKIM